MKKLFSIWMAAVFAILLSSGLSQPVQAANSASTAGTVATASGSLNVRSSASTSGKIVSSLPRGGSVTLLSKSGSWWQVEYADGKYGYVHGDYIKSISGSFAAQVNTSYGNLNVRQGAGTNYAIQTSLPKGKTVVVLSQSGGWSKILYHGTRTGFVSSQYLKAFSGASAYPAVKLSVVSFKQTDPRWANVKLGSSGQTIAQIGCTTTGLAMMESFRTGTTIYPDAMAKKLSYSAGGALYWPSNYMADTNANGYLGKLYALLKQGKPAFIGAKTASGGQHWVVVTGYQGGNTLSASQFLVNDPGSNTVTNLQQFLNKYPNFYKIMSYK